MISIIVPCYNCENTIMRCCQSIFNQKFTNYEIIFVNDGSTDNTEALLEDIVNNNPDRKIKKITTENNGVSVARNVGLSNANGQFIGFVDSDDFIHPDMLNRMYTHIISSTNVDLVICNFSMDNHEEFGIVGKPQFISRNKLTKDLFYNFEVQGFMCNKLYKKSIIKHNKIFFNSNLKVMEDLDFNLNYAQYVNQSIYDSSKLYYYSTEDSLTMFNGLTSAKLSLLDHYKELYSYNLEELTKLLDCHYVSYLLTLLSNCWTEPNDCTDEEIPNLIISEIKKKKNIYLKYGYAYGLPKYISSLILLVSPKTLQKIVKYRK